MNFAKKPVSQLPNAKRVAKLIRRQRDGRPLTAAERKTVDAYRERKREASQWVSRAALAALVKAHPNSITRWVRNYAADVREIETFKRTNGQWNPAAFRDFMARHDLKPDDREGGDGMPAGQRSALATVKLDIEIEKLHRLRRENQIEGGQVYMRAVVDAWQGELAATLKAMLTQRLLAELPPKLVGMDAGAIGRVMEKLIAEISAAMTGKPQRG